MLSKGGGGGGRLVLNNWNVSSQTKRHSCRKHSQPNVDREVKIYTIQSLVHSLAQFFLLSWVIVHKLLYNSMTSKTVFHREHQIRVCFQRIKLPQFQTRHVSTYMSTDHKAGFEKESTGEGKKPQQKTPTEKKKRNKHRSSF